MGYSQNSLTSYIYEMALGRSSWDSILDVLSAAFPNSLIFVTGHDLVRHTSLVFAQRGLSPAAVQTYLSTYADQNPWLDGQAELAPFQIYHDDQLLPREDAAKTTFYRDWLSRQGDYAAATGVVVLNGGDVDYSGYLTTADWAPIPAGGSATFAFLPVEGTGTGTLEVSWRSAWW